MPQKKRDNIRSRKGEPAVTETKPSAGLYNKALDEAIQTIYRVYGSNLAAFFRDVEDPVIHGEAKSSFCAQLVEQQTRRPQRRASKP